MWTAMDESSPDRMTKASVSPVFNNLDLRHEEVSLMSISESERSVLVRPSSESVSSSELSGMVDTRWRIPVVRRQVAGSYVQAYS